MSYKKLFFFPLFFLLINLIAIPQENSENLKSKLEQATNDNEKISILKELCKSYKNSNPEECLNFAKQLLYLTEKTNNKNEEINALLNIAEINYSLKNYKQTIEYYNKSIEFYSEFDSKEGMAYSLSNIAKSYKKLGKSDKAIESCLKAVKIYEKLGKSETVISLFDFIASMYNQEQEYKKSINYYQKELELCQKINNDKEVAETLNKIGSVYSNWGNYQKALEYLKKSLSVANQINYIELASLIKNNISTVNSNIENKKEIKTQYDIKKESETGDYISILKKTNIYFKQKNVKSLEEIEKLSIENQAKELKILVLQERYEKQLLQNKLKQQKIENLERKKKIKELELKNEKNIKIFLIITTILILLLSITNLKRIKK